MTVWPFDDMSPQEAYELAVFLTGLLFFLIGCLILFYWFVIRPYFRKRRRKYGR